MEQHDQAVVDEIAKVQHSIEDVNLGKRVSSSSEEAVDTSDELMEIDHVFAGVPVPGASDAQPPRAYLKDRPVAQLALEQEEGALTLAQKMIKEAEATRGKMLAAKGTYSTNFQDFLKTAYVDEEYMVFGSHLDDGICKKIINHEYIDFAKLLPCDKVGMKEDQ